MSKSFERDNSEKTIKDVIDTMNEEQKNVLYMLVGMAAEGKDTKKKMRRRNNE